MAAPRRQIRSLAAFFAFEAAGRHGSFTAAAGELGVTHAAVSKQVAAMERDVGTRLFDRLHRRVRLTDSGQELFCVATQALGMLGDAVERLRGAEHRRPVSIAATLSMSRFWLLPRLPALRAAHPDIQIRVVSEEEAVLNSRGSADLVIRYGEGTGADGSATPLFRSAIYPMASPGLLASRPRIATVDDVLAAPLIDYDAPDPPWTTWTDWVRKAGLPARPLGAALSFSRYFDALQAAVEGQGILLGWGGVTGGAEERGDLVRLPGPVIAPRGEFHLVVAASAEAPDLRSVTGWLLEEARRQAAATEAILKEA